MHTRSIGFYKKSNKILRRIFGPIKEGGAWRIRVELNTKLTFKPHLSTLATKTSRDLAYLYPLLNSQDIPQKSKLLIHRSTILPKLLYASPIWPGMSGKTPVLRLQIQIRKILRIILRLQRRLRNKLLHQVAEEPLLRQRLMDNAEAFFGKTAAKENHLATLAADDPTVWDRYKRPISSTGLAVHQPPK
jgi:hypothetical protein